MPVCRKCQQEKDRFPPKSRVCRDCAAEKSRLWAKNNPERAKERSARHKREHPEMMRRSQEKWRLANPEKARESRKRATKKYQEKNKDILREKRRLRDAANPEKRRAYRKAYHNKNKSDPYYRLKYNLRCRLSLAITRNYKSGSAVRDLGCSIEELHAHLSAKFVPGMSWGNYGKWHIDHIQPLSSFDLNDRTQLLQAVHFSNLQPLWAEDNMRKGAKR